MKPFFILLVLTAGAFAQSAPPATEILPPVVVEQHAVDAPTPLSRIDLEFKGGTPAALVEAISKAIGKQLNVIIDGQTRRCASRRSM